MEITVKDTTSGFLQAFRTKEFRGEAVNLGTGAEISIKDLALKIASLMGKKIKLVQEVRRTRGAKTEVERLCSDNSKMKAYTDWKPRYDLDAGLKETIVWLRKNQDGYKSGVYNV